MGGEFLPRARVEILERRNRFQCDLNYQDSIEAVPQAREIFTFGMRPKEKAHRNCQSGIRIKGCAAVTRLLTKRFQYWKLAGLEVLRTRYFDPSFLFSCEIHRTQNTRLVLQVNLLKRTD